MSDVRARLVEELRAPIMAAPMFLVSGLPLVKACCRAGVVGAWQAGNPRTAEEFQAWLDALSEAGREARGEGRPFAPYAINLLAAGGDPDALAQRLGWCEKAKTPLLVTSLGDPSEIVRRAHGWGGLVIHDATTIRFAEKAIAAGVDGLLLVCAGAGGHTGALSPFAFIPKVRRMFDGLIVAAGGIADGAGVAAALAMGADMACLGTRFIAARESGAPEGHKAMLVESGMEDVMLSDSISGLPAHWLRGSILAHGLDPGALPPSRGARRGAELPQGVRAWRDIWSAGHSAGLIEDAPTVDAIIDRLCREFEAAPLQQGWHDRLALRLGCRLDATQRSAQVSH